MKIGVPRERQAGEYRVALTPTAVASLAARDIEVVVESGAGELAGFTDGAYTGTGANVVTSEQDVLASDLTVWVGPPSAQQLDLLPSGGAVVGFLEPFSSTDILRRLVDRHLSAFAFEAVPRVTAAQAMDALSSQATAAGYAAVLLGAATSRKFFPMLTTAAGTIAPAKVLVLGAGVAGLQAIATAKRLGASVSAYDIRPEAAEQIESVGGRPIDLETDGLDSEGGYAPALATNEQERQHELLTPHVADSDVVITTAAVPGRSAPILVTHQMVHRMRPGAVIVDLAAPTGGNCEVTYIGETRVHGNGVVICGPTDLPSRVAQDASQMYGRNVLALLDRLIIDGELVVDLADEVLSGTCVTHRGEVRHPLSRKLLGLDTETVAASEGGR
ncbi:MAG: Re/Si-specific NAD(P)(+) transhydrogenase subunit alpha [Nitriliruptorales bacterium]|nr:Re/Si-specific NAD(P)(+) transhydrogenase subunit alpha [Nitriliruptorales bacterium]